MHVRRAGRALALALLGVLGSACTPSAADPTAVEGSFEVGGRSLYLSCAGKGTPTVVMDAGLGNGHQTWDGVAPELTAASRVCTYDRANIGDSDDAPTPRSSEDVVADLSGLLAAAGIGAPYVLVGHSFGGINVQVFAAEHPDDVSGLVLVDPTPITFLDDECAVVGRALCRTLRAGFAPSHNPDGLDFVRSGTDLRSAGPLPAVPVAVLVATRHHQDAVTSRATERLIEAAWRRSQEELVSGLEQGTLTVVPGGHDIQQLHPDAVVHAVRSVLRSAG